MANDDAIVEGPATVDESFRDEITAILTKRRESIVGQGDDLSVWIKEHITTSNAKMAEGYAEEVLENCREECKQKAYYELPEYGRSLHQVLPNPHKPSTKKRYGNTLRDYKARLGELGADIKVVRDGMFIVEGAIRKARKEREIEAAEEKEKASGYSEKDLGCYDSPIKAFVSQTHSFL